MRNAVIEISATSKYAKDLTFLSLLEQTHGRNCYRVVDRVNYEAKRLADCWNDYINQQDINKSINRFNNNKHLQDIIHNRMER